MVTAGWTQSQHPELPFDHLNIPGTINSSQVTDLIQDHHGLIWVAGNGLYRYDGYKFNSYSNINDSIPISGQEIHCLFNDAITNQLLLGTHSHGIIKRDYVSGKFKVVPSRGGIPIITHIAQTSDGTVWGSSFSNGVSFIENDTLKKFTDSNENFISNSCIASQGNKLFVGGNRSVYIIENKKVVDTIYITHPDFNSLRVTRVTAILVDGTGKVWIGTEQSGVFVYEMATKNFVKHFSPDSSPFHFRINKIFEDKNGNIWMLTKGEGVVVYSPSTDSYIQAVKNPLNDRSLTGNICTSIFQDRTDIIWIGTTGDLNRYDPAKIRFRHINNNPFASISLHDNMVRGVYEDMDKKLWVGTDGGVVHVFDKSRATIEKIALEINGKKRITPFYFLDFDKNTLLIGTSEGLLQYDRQTKKTGYFPPLQKHTHGQQVRQMVLLNENLYYTSFGFLHAYNFKTRALTTYNNRWDSEKFKNATTLYVDKANRLWIGVRDGLLLYNPATDEFKQFTIEKNSARPIGSYFMVLSIYEYMNKLWIGSFNDGLWTLDLANLNNPVITNVSKEHDIQNMTVYSTLPDNAGNIWMSTNAGITRYNPKTDQYLDFTVTEGLQQDEFNRLAFTHCSNGDIVYGGVNGLNIFNPKNIVVEEKDYTPILLDIAVFDEASDTSIPIEFDSTLIISLAHDQNDIDIGFFVPFYRNPKRYESFYKLEGNSIEWTKAETNTFHFGNLKPGVYNFVLKTVSVSGKEKLASLKFTIRKPFWQTWWFIALAIVSICLIVVAIIQGSLYKSRRDKERLEQLLKIRTQEIEKSREELTHLNQKKDLIFSILSHDLRRP